MILQSFTICCLFWTQQCLVLASENHNSENEPKEPSWLVINRSPNQNFTLTCQDSQYYPFNSTNLAKRIIWQVPIGSVYLYLENYQKQFGWQVLSNGRSLEVNPALFPKALSIAGIYKCALLAPLRENTTYHAWHYLTWAVDYYAEENLLVGLTPTEKYSRNLYTLLIVWASFLGIIVLLKLMHIYSYESRHKEFTSRGSIVVTSLDNQIRPVDSFGF